MRAEKAKTFLLIAGLSVVVLLGSAPAMAGDQPLDCRVISSTPEDIDAGATNSHTVTCDADLIVTGGGQHCGLSPDSQTGLPLHSSSYPVMTPVGDPPTQWVCDWKNTESRTASCQCDAICCSDQRDCIPVEEDCDDGIDNDCDTLVDEDDDDCPSPICSHSLCDTGLACPPEANSCVADVCACDPFCCTNSWDAFCVHEAQQLCSAPNIPIDGCGSQGSCLAACGCPGSP